MKHISPQFVMAGLMAQVNVKPQPAKARKPRLTNAQKAAVRVACQGDEYYYRVWQESNAWLKGVFDRAERN